MASRREKMTLALHARFVQRLCQKEAVFHRHPGVVHGVPQKSRRRLIIHLRFQAPVFLRPAAVRTDQFDAFPVRKRAGCNDPVSYTHLILVIFGMTDRLLFLVCCLVTFFIFSLLYLFVYHMTAHTYYRLVEA